MSDNHGGPGVREYALLLARFLRSPRTVGAVAPSSRALARAMVAHLDAGNSPASARIVELGPGTGSFTSEIVKRLGPDSRFLALDIDPAFVDDIRRRWPQVDCRCASAADLDRLARDAGMWPVDHVISGLPFVSLPPATTRQVLEAIAAALRAGGTFTTFQYVHGYRFPTAVAFRRLCESLIGPAAAPQRVLPNLPPAYVLRWKRGG